MSEGVTTPFLAAIRSSSRLRARRARSSRLGLLYGRFGRGNVVLRGSQLIPVCSLDVFFDGDLGQFAGGRGILIIDLGVLDCDLRVGEPVAQHGRVELANDIALLDVSSLGLDLDDGRPALDVAKNIVFARRFQPAGIDDRELESAGVTRNVTGSSAWLSGQDFRQRPAPRALAAARTFRRLRLLRRRGARWKRLSTSG